MPVLPRTHNTIFWNTRYPGGNSTSGFYTRTTSGTVGLALNVPIFAGFSVENQIKQTLALEDKAKADLDGVQRNVVQGTRAIFFNVKSGLGQVKALETAEISTKSALDANILGYQVGVRINLDVLNSQSQLYVARRDLDLQRYNVLTNSLKLRQAAGVLKPEDLEQINALLVK